MKVDRSKIRLVDGFKIRSTIDIDFSTLHTYSINALDYAPKFYIPKGEWWLDHKFRDELDFIVDMDEIGARLISEEGLTYHEAREKMKKELTTKPPIPNFEISRRNEGGLDIVVVNGKIVRQYLDPDFVAGGHEFVYSYVPVGEIWLDNKLDEEEQPYVELHEKVEREYMKAGKSYDVGHEYANTIEKEKRRADGIAHYPGDENNPWDDKTNEELAKEFYVT